MADTGSPMYGQQKNLSKNVGYVTSVQVVLQGIT